MAFTQEYIVAHKEEIGNALQDALRCYFNTESLFVTASGVTKGEHGGPEFSFTISDSGNGDIKPAVQDFATDMVQKLVPGSKPVIRTGRMPEAS